MAAHSLSDQEMVEILEGIARDARNAAAQIAAIKMLREWRAGERPSDDGFAELDGARGRLKAV